MKHIFHKDSEEHNFWMSYTDLMSAFLIVFIIISAILYNYYNAKVEEANDAKEIAQVEKNRYENLMDSIRSELEKSNNRAEEQARIIKEMEANDLKNLVRQFESVFVYDSDVISEIDTIRGSIKLTHRDSYMKKDLFPSGKSVMQPALKRYLDRVGRDLVVTAMRINDYRGSNGIEVRIEGHTDPTWEYNGPRGTDDGYLKNLELSSARANAVYRYIYENCNLTSTQKLFVKKNMISVGYSFSERIIMNNIDLVDEDAKSRRIEFRIISK